MERRETRRKQKRNTDYWQAGDRFLYRLALTVLVFMILIQAVMVIYPSSGLYFNTALRMEGKSLDLDDQVSLVGGISAVPWALLSLKLDDYISLPEVKILVDGEETGCFTHREVAINVKHGSVVSVYNPDRSRLITVTVSRKTPNVREPALGSSVSGSGTLYFEPVVISN